MPPKTQAPPAPAKGGAEPSFDDLVADILQNPERILDKDITPEQVLALQKQLNPYAYVAGDAGSAEHKRSVAISTTNLRADYIKRFTMTGLVGFLFRMLDEWTVPAEARRWVSKAGAKRGAAEAAARRKAAPLTPDDLLQRAEALRELALLAKEAGGEAAAAQQAAAQADDVLIVATGAGAPPAEVAALKETLAARLKTADAALAKARGLLYSATFELRKHGLEADDRIDAVAAVARAHPEIAAMIDRDPVRRPPPGQTEIPEAPAKAIISNFLRAWFEFNPDAHVRKAHDEFIIRKATAPAEVEGLPGKHPVDAADPERLPLEVVLAAAPAFADPADKETFAALTVSREAYNAAAYMLRNETAMGALLSAYEAAPKFRRYLFPIPAGSAARAAAEVVPPQDTFHRWNYYMEVNHEELRTATEAIYHEKPDLDWALIVYEAFEGTEAEVEAAFEKFRDEHQDEVISDIKGVDFGSWTLLGDFKENRDKLTFYNKHTDVLKRILDRHAEDKKLGTDLMRNRVRQLKAKNIRDDGPDAPGLGEYKTQNPGLSAMGAERVISREEMYRLERAKGNLRAAQELEALDQYRQVIADLSAAAKVRELTPEEDRRLKDAQKDIVNAQEMIEVPDNAIQVDVFSHDARAGTFGKSKFYTQAEAPEYIRDIQREQAGLPVERPRGSAAAPVDEPTSMRRPARGALPPNAQTTTVADLAPFAQHELAREVAASRLAEAGGAAAPALDAPKPE